MSRTERATKVFFWGAFSAFLAMSIPHIAFIFRFYEPHHDTFDLAWWVVSYGVAIGIDLLICWLSYSRSETHNGSRFDGFITWGFIFLLAILSWYCNWLFAELMTGIDVWSIPLFLGGTVGSITPFIVSAIPMFMIAYTYMSKHILSHAHVKTVAELQSELNGLDERVSLEMQIKQKRKAMSGPGLIQRTKKTVLEVKQAVKDVVKTSETDSQNIPMLPASLPENEPEMEVILSENEGQIEDELSGEMPPISERTTDPNLHAVSPVESVEGQEIMDRQEEAPRQMKTQKRYTVEEAIRLPLCKQNSIKITDIRAAIKAGHLRANQSGTLSKTALENWIKMRQKTAA